MPETDLRKVLKNLSLTAGAVVLSTALYYVMPLTGFGVLGTAATAAVFALGLLAVSATIVLQTWRFWSTKARSRASLAGVVTALYLSVLFFASMYFGMAYHRPGSIASLETRTDALYFSLTITSTVGFGDVHAVGQGARLMVIVHMAFNIGFLGLVLSVLRTAASRRV